MRGLVEGEAERRGDKKMYCKKGTNLKGKVEDGGYRSLE